ncbi:MAG: bL35 family ribosomal protein [Planctomycetota bacterium]
MRTTHKPNKSYKKRVKITATGKVVYQQGNRRHLLSGRTGDQLRRYARPAVLDETQGKPIRALIGAGGKNPAKIAYLKQQAMKKKSSE